MKKLQMEARDELYFSSCRNSRVQCQAFVKNVPDFFGIEFRCKVREIALYNSDFPQMEKHE